MKTSLEHLPLPKREQLAAITALLCEGAPVEMLILFGSYARGDWVEDHENLYFSDYDLLVVVREPAVAADEMLWSALNERARALTGSTLVSLFVHDIKQLNQEIRRGRYFFSDILVEGVILFNSRRLMLAKPKALSPAERLDIAHYDFQYWFGSASAFWHGSAYYQTMGQLAHAAFLLHQAAERYYHATLLVFTGYKPKTHDLIDLADQVSPLHAALVEPIPRTLPLDEELFTLLKRSYIEARYSKSFRITVQELTTLRGRVRDLAIAVRLACAEQLATFVNAEAVRPLHEPPVDGTVFGLPDPPSFDDAAAVEKWRDSVAWLTEQRARSERDAGVMEGLVEGERRGLQEGLVEGERRGLQEGERRGVARLIVDVLARRGVPLTAAEATMILECPDSELLNTWWQRALTADSVQELVGTGS